MVQYPTTPLKYLWFYVRKKKKETFLTLLLIGIGTLLSRFTLQAFSHIIDILNNADQPSFGTALGWTVCVMVLLEISSIVFRYIGFQYELRVTPWVVKQVEHDISSYLMGHSARFLVNQSSGKLVDRVGQVAEGLSRMIGMIEFDFFMPAVTALTTLWMLLWVNWSCALLFVVWMFILFFVFKKYGTYIQKASAHNSEKEASVIGRIVDIVSNALTVKSFSNQRYEEKRLNPLLDECKKASEKLYATEDAVQTKQSFILGLFRLMMVGLALILWAQGKITTGNIVLTLLLANTMVDTVRYFMFTYNNWGHEIGSVRNALESIFVPHEIQDCPNAQKLRAVKGKVEFKNVDFGYRTKTGVFKKFNLTIHPGERVGLVGVSGSGKSSLINLLQRFYEANSGQIFIDGQDICSVTQDSLHAAISLVPQDTSLFHRSLYDNIAYGNPKADKNQIIRAARLAYAHDFILKTEKGYQTLVGDRGIRLSGGQRQRIAIARAILKQAPILILDEATSALDSESEIHIQKSLKNLMKGKTVIAVAHRLSTLREMDRIIVMHKGKIIEQGKPAELLKKKGRYAHLWQLQTQGFILPED